MADLKIEITRLKRDIALIAEARQELLVLVAKDPSNVDLHDQLDQLDKEAAARNTSLERLTGALEVARHVDQAARAAEEKQHQADCRRKSIDLLDERVDLVKQFNSAWPQVVELLNDIQAHGQEARALAQEGGALRASDGGSDYFLAEVGAVMSMSLRAAGLHGMLGFIDCRHVAGYRELDPLESIARRKAQQARG